MKALRIPCLLLSALFLLALLNSIFIDQKCQVWVEEVYTVDSLAAHEDWAESEKKLSALYQDWQDAQLYLHMTVHRNTLDTVEEQFRCCTVLLQQQDMTQLPTSLTSLAAQLQFLGDTEQLHPRNIF